MKMILGFSTQINGKPTHFVEKIIKSIIEIARKKNNQLLLADDLRQLHRYCIQFNLNYAHVLGYVEDVIAKNHTIREDKNNRWLPGIMIDFFINVRTRNMCRFAPKIPVVSTQKITINWASNVDNLKMIGQEYDCQCVIFIDDKFFGDAIFNKGILISSSYNFKELSLNDGFDTTEDFFNYFDKNFTGKINHWTDKRY
jgi:hypothetical protein